MNEVTETYGIILSSYHIVQCRSGRTVSKLDRQA